MLRKSDHCVPRVPNLAEFLKFQNIHWNFNLVIFTLLSHECLLMNAEKNTNRNFW